MTYQEEFGSTILVRAADGTIHTADVSDIMAHTVDHKSVRTSLMIYFKQHNLTPLSIAESALHGFPARPIRLDRVHHLLRAHMRRM